VFDCVCSGYSSECVFGVADRQEKTLDKTILYTDVYSICMLVNYDNSAGHCLRGIQHFVSASPFGQFVVWKHDYSSVQTNKPIKHKHLQVRHADSNDAQLQLNLYDCNFMSV